MDRLPTEVLLAIFMAIGESSVRSVLALASTSKSIRKRYLDSRNDKYIPHTIASRHVNGLIAEVRFLALLENITEDEYRDRELVEERLRQTQLPYHDVDLKFLWDAARTAVQIRTIFTWILASGLPGNTKDKAVLDRWFWGLPGTSNEFKAQGPVDLDARANDFRCSSFTSLLRIGMLSRIVIKINQLSAICFKGNPGPLLYKHLAEKLGTRKVMRSWTYTSIWNTPAVSTKEVWEKAARFKTVQWMVEYAVRCHIPTVKDLYYSMDFYPGSAHVWRRMSLEQLVKVAGGSPIRTGGGSPAYQQGQVYYCVFWPDWGMTRRT